MAFRQWLRILCGPSASSSKISRWISMGTAAVGVAYYIADGVSYEKLADYYSRKDKEAIVKIPDDLEDLIMDEVELFAQKRKAESVDKLGSFKLARADQFWNYRFVSTSGDKFRRFGSPRSFFGSCIGVPEVLCSEEARERFANKWLAKRLDNPSTLSTDLMTKVGNSYDLSSKAKRFLIQRELHSIWCIDRPFAISCLTIVTAFLLGKMHSFSVNCFNKAKLALSIRAIVLFYIITAIAFLYLFILQYGKQYTEETANRGAMALGEDYKQGAVEVYEKILERNVAVQEVLKNQGKKKFLPNGDPLLKWYELPGMKYSQLLDMARTFEPTEADSQPFSLYV
ncbi:Transmembrane protein 177 [Trichuris trichiura]|uniref:Transmembrane protein 177 n=1 Tax=Trichuris trichiura TaxID=36087 RepID=A0A077Z7V3_TRITR|nr:Transmembrane protein 177 [Trichuris trichiura]